LNDLAAKEKPGRRYEESSDNRQRRIRYLQRFIGRILHSHPAGKANHHRPHRSLLYRNSVSERSIQAAINVLSFGRHSIVDFSVQENTTSVPGYDTFGSAFCNSAADHFIGCKVAFHDWESKYRAGGRNGQRAGDVDEPSRRP
jgi:hypothetical protein